VILVLNLLDLLVVIIGALMRWSQVFVKLAVSDVTGFKRSVLCGCRVEIRLSVFAAAKTRLPLNILLQLFLRILHELHVCQVFEVVLKHCFLVRNLCELFAVFIDHVQS
jgi:hypothetical protein